MRNFGFVLLFLFGTSAFAQVSEDFDANSQSSIEAGCWEFDGVGISKPPTSKALNGGNDRPLADADLDGTGSASLASPYIKFDGSNTLTFQHKLLAANGTFSELEVFLEDPTGVRTSVFSHTYRSGGSNANGNPTNSNSESVSTSFSGYARVIFVWTYTSTSTNGYLDEFSLDGEYAADASSESDGYCPAQFDFTDTVCAGDQNVLYTALYNRSTESYTWSFTSASAGTIDDNISTNDSTVELDFDTITGDFQLVGTESNTGHQTIYDIHVHALPSVSHTIDSVCLDEPYDIELTLTGTGPWELQYQYTGSSTQTVTINSSPYTLSLPAEADTFTFISLSDNNGCEIDGGWLPTVTVPYFDKPAPVEIEVIE
ncbi:hypothetical protein [Phaeocystidibacter luteus]|uniref:PKD domain-containing protein n=1 Tax=Phaeocystidibacter luteus TaxID=911197 RepID=A0A6N6RHS4_9FLAO|nr:hypothetical protein [Phaeocystidibacter luteus]KAB2813938.1 hypothetical protein F8C67_04430 [Phaeocystidibacter luteus]